MERNTEEMLTPAPPSTPPALSVLFLRVRWAPRSHSHLRATHTHTRTRQNTEQNRGAVAQKSRPPGSLAYGGLF